MRSATAAPAEPEPAHRKAVKSFMPGREDVSAWCASSWTPKATGSYRQTITAKDLAGVAQSKAGSATITLGARIRVR